MNLVWAAAQTASHIDTSLVRTFNCEELKPKCKELLAQNIGASSHQNNSEETENTSLKMKNCEEFFLTLL